MKLQIALIAALALAAGPAAAEFGSGKPNNSWGRQTPGGAPASQPSPGFGLPATNGGPAHRGATTSRIYSPPAPPKAEPFKPYQPYKPSNVFGPDSQKKKR